MIELVSVWYLTARYHPILYRIFPTTTYLENTLATLCSKYANYIKLSLLLNP